MDEAKNRGFTYRGRIPARDAGVSVIEHLRRRHAHSSEAAWRGRIDGGLVLVDGAPARADDPLVEGAILEWTRPPWVEPPAPLHFRVLHDDGEVLAVDKPAGLPTLPGGGFLDRTLLALVRRSHPGASPVHRLGRWTSGVTLFALTGLARAHLSEAFRTGGVGKRYRALATGRPAAGAWIITTPIGPAPHDLLGTVHAASCDGRAARSEVTVLEQRGDVFLADVVIATGRPHQIRIHLAASGHPLVGDPLYAAGGLPIPGTRALPGDPGYRLHAAEVVVDRPQGGGELIVSAFPPPELRRAGEALP